MRILLTGPKGSGKTSVGRILAEQLSIPHLDLDAVLEDEYESATGNRLTCREIYASEGEPVFRDYESRAAEAVADRQYCVISTGGTTLLYADNRRKLRRGSIVVFLRGEADLFWPRVAAEGIPAFITGDDPEAEFAARVEKVTDVVLPYADVVVDLDTDDSPETLADRIRGRVAEELLLNSTRFSTLGTVLRVHTFGESHGPAIGAVLDGVPPGVSLSEQDIQKDLDRRRPGQSGITTARSESDSVRILSGVFEGRTTGAPVALLIENVDQKSKDYEPFRDIFRPGHADFTFWSKYGIRDHRGGGRSSGRETAARVAAGAVARKYLAECGVSIRAYSLEIGGVRAETIDHAAIEQNPVRCPDTAAAPAMEEAIRTAREAGDSVGGVIQLKVEGVAAGLGDPVFGKLDARLAAGLVSIGAVKGVEFGAGFEAARLRGSRNNDPMRDGRFVTNNAGGILGGISTGEPIVARVAVKPTASISSRQQTCDIEGRNRDIEVSGRHDPCIVPRAVPVVEAMAALVVLDCMLIQQRIHPR